MKKLLYLLIFCLSFTISCCNFAPAQSVNGIKSKCAGTLVYSEIQISAAGDIVHTPCSGKASIFNGNVDFTGATVTGVITGSGTANFVPRFTASQIIGNTPFSWDGTNYNWQNTALDSGFEMDLTPSTASGIFSVGSSTNVLSITQSTGILQALSATENRNRSALFTIDNPTGNAQFVASFTPSVAAGRFRAGDYTTTPTTFFDLNQTANTFTVSASAMTFSNQTAGNNSIFLTYSDATQRVDIGKGSGSLAYWDFANNQFRWQNAADTSYVNYLPAVSFFEVNASGGISFTTGAGSMDITAGTLILGGIANFTQNRTVTGTVGAVTINKPYGRVIVGAGTASTVVTNSLATANSQVLVTMATDDATCLLKNVVAGAGSFTINTTANCTANANFNFQLTN